VRQSQSSQNDRHEVNDDTRRVDREASNARPLLEQERARSTALLKQLERQNDRLSELEQQIADMTAIQQQLIIKRPTSDRRGRGNGRSWSVLQNNSHNAGDVMYVSTAVTPVTVLESVSSPPLPHALSYPDRASYLWMMRGSGGGGGGGGVFRRWTECWFVLKGTELFWFAEKWQAEPTGVCTLAGVKLVTDARNITGREHSFGLLDINNDQEIFLACQTAVDAVDWTTHIISRTSTINVVL